MRPRLCSEPQLLVVCRVPMLGSPQEGCVVTCHQPQPHPDTAAEQRTLDTHIV